MLLVLATKRNSSNCLGSGRSLVFENEAGMSVVECDKKLPVNNTGMKYFTLSLMNKQYMKFYLFEI